MSDQARHWSAAADRYEQQFVDPYKNELGHPLFTALQNLPSPSRKTVADLGCGTGPLLPRLAGLFAQVHAIDFAPGMLDRARQRCLGLTNVCFHLQSLEDLSALAGQVDVALAVNSLVQPNMEQIVRVLCAIHRMLRRGGQFLGIVPAMDSVHYHTMLLLNHARARGLDPQSARRDAALQAEHELYDFAFQDFRYLGLEQHFWFPFEIRYCLRRAGFRHIRLARVRLGWEQFARGAELSQEPPLWDWFFNTRR